jgi:hypothetical protein
MKSPSYEKEDPDGYLPTPGHPVPFNVALEGRFRISEAMAATNALDHQADIAKVQPGLFDRSRPCRQRRSSRRALA